MEDSPNPEASRTARRLWLIGLALGMIAGLAVAIPLAQANASTAM